MRFLVYLYYTQPFYRTSTYGQNHAYCISIFTVMMIMMLMITEVKSYVGCAFSICFSLLMRPTRAVFTGDSVTGLNDEDEGGTEADIDAFNSRSITAMNFCLPGRRL